MDSGVLLVEAGNSVDAGIFELLNRLHTDADAYTPDPSLRDRYDLDENQLRDRATKTLRELEEVLHAL